jgi:hypothetical protein
MQDADRDAAMMTSLATPPAITPRRSLLLAVYIVGVHAGAALAVLSARLPAMIGFLSIVLLSALCIRALRLWREGRWSGPGTFRLCDDGVWLHTYPGLPARHLELVPPWFVHPWLVIMRLRPRDGRGAPVDLVLPPDSLPPDQARHLRVWLRLGRVVSEG